MKNPQIAQVEALYAAFGRGDVATFIAGLTNDVDWVVVGPPGAFPTFGVRKGAREVEKFFGVLIDNEDISEFVPTEFHASEDKVFVIGRLTSMIKKTGRKYSSDWLHVFTLKGGKVSAFKEFYDSAAIVAAYKS
jgi:hypothetical protein